MATERAIIHVDMDAFYASVEELDDPTLAGKPVIVGGLGGRGVVSTCNYEARKYGVHSAMPTSRAHRLCPQAVFIFPRHERYAEISAQVFAVFGEFTDDIEGLSLDEAFLDVTGSLRLFASIEAIGRQIKLRIRERTGLTASVGMAANKLVAKLASELSKPDGFLRVRPEEVRATLDPLPVGRLWTVGKVAEEQAAPNRHPHHRRTGPMRYRAGCSGRSGVRSKACRRLRGARTSALYTARWPSNPSARRTLSTWISPSSPWPRHGCCG